MSRIWGYNDGAIANNLGLTLASANFIITGGNVGIGTNDTKGHKLAVPGILIVESIKVQLQTSWPDYVFGKDYKLPSLDSIERQIKETGHLSGIPSSSQAKLNGVDLGEMNGKLLKKIEEITLHMIAMKKQLNAQALEIQSLKSGNRQLVK